MPAVSHSFLFFWSTNNISYCRAKSLNLSNNVWCYCGTDLGGIIAFANSINHMSVLVSLNLANSKLMEGGVSGIDI
jgi:hypothetical protein